MSSEGQFHPVRKLSIKGKVIIHSSSVYLVIIKSQHHFHSCDSPLNIVLCLCRIYILVGGDRISRLAKYVGGLSSISCSTCIYFEFIFPCSHKNWNYFELFFKSIL